MSDLFKKYNNKSKKELVEIVCELHEQLTEMRMTASNLRHLTNNYEAKYLPKADTYKDLNRKQLVIAVLNRDDMLEQSKRLLREETDKIEGWKVIAERFKRKMGYWRSKYIDSEERAIGLSVTMDMEMGEAPRKDNSQ